MVTSAKAKEKEIIEIRPLDIKTVALKIIGTSPLIMHAWSEKAKREMLAKQMKETKTSGKSAKNPVEDFIRSMYWFTEMPTDFTEAGFEAAIAKGARFGFPVAAIKQSGISAAYREGWFKSMAELRGAFFMDGVADFSGTSMVEIKSDPPVMREDMVRIGNGVADIRYRGEFRNWSAEIGIEYNSNGRITLEQIINIVNLGGFTCGIGEWRPEKDGQYGMFKVSD